MISHSSRNSFVDLTTPCKWRRLHCAAASAGPSPAKQKANHVFFFAVHRLRVQAPFFIVIQQNWLQWAPILFPTNPTSMYVHIFGYSLYSYLYITYISPFFWIWLEPPKHTAGLPFSLFNFVSAETTFWSHHIQCAVWPSATVEDGGGFEIKQLIGKMEWPAGPKIHLGKRWLRSTHTKGRRPKNVTVAIVWFSGFSSALRKYS